MSSFYIGYLPKTPADIANFVRRIVVGLMMSSAVAAALAVLGQQIFPAVTFEWNTVREFHGVIEEKPYPTLIIRRPGSASSGQQYSRYLLVGLGKHGADSDIAGFAGKSVDLKGKLIYRSGITMIEVMPGTVHGAKVEPAPGDSQSLGPITVSGEIADSKCYAGVMNPGRGKVHRDCAVRCLSGGAPPVLVEHGGDGRIFVLISKEGGPLRKDDFLDRVAEPVVVQGQLVRKDNQLQLLVEKIRRGRV